MRVPAGISMLAIRPRPLLSVCLIVKSGIGLEGMLMAMREGTRTALRVSGAGLAGSLEAICGSESVEI
jgi:hypothetical protein